MGLERRHRNNLAGQRHYQHRNPPTFHTSNNNSNDNRFAGTMFEQSSESSSVSISASTNNHHHHHHHQDDGDDDEEMVSFLHDKNTTDDKDRRHQINQHQLSDWEAGISLAKAIMGAGSFALPWAFSNMGYVAGPICLVLLMLTSMYSMRILIHSNNSNSNSNSNSNIASSYVALAQTSFGRTGARLSYAASVSASIGVCGSYLVFIAANLESLSRETIEISQTLWIIVVAPMAMALSSVQNMKHFALASLLGDVAVVLGMLVVVVYAVWNHTIQWDDVVAVASYRTMPLSFGAIGYLFLVHFLVLPIRSNMRYPDHFCQIADRTFVVCAFLSGAFGVVGYLYFGSKTEQIVLLNVQEGPLVIKAVQLLLCVDLLFTYPVVMRPSIVILVQQQQQQQEDGGGNGKMKSPSSARRYYVMACILLGLIAASCSIFIPAFGILSGLVGGVSQTFLAFVLPPLVYLQQQQEQKQHLDDKKPLGLVVMGGVLIVWTLASTWNELSSSTSS
jgi:proton-coupled amino acid transporter